MMSTETTTTVATSVIALRIPSLMSCRIALMSPMKRRMIRPGWTLPLRLERQLAFEAESLRVSDRLIPGRGLARLTRFQVAATVSMHTPSGRQEPARNIACSVAAAERILERLNAGQEAAMTFVVHCDGRTEEIQDA